MQSRAALPAVLELLAAGRLHVHEITTRTVGWKEVAEAWLEPSVKLVLDAEVVA